MIPATEMRSLVDRHFKVYDAQQEALRGSVAARLYFLQVKPEEFDARFAAFRAELSARDPEAIAFIRREGGEDILFIADRPPPSPRRLAVHGGLFVATLVTTVTAGALWWRGYTEAGQDVDWSVLWSPLHLGWGFLTFALPLMLILGIHETAHYVAAKRHGLRATLPFFLPIPPILMPIGTLGAFISMKDPLPDRKALFDVGASGPIAGFLVAVPVLVLGAWLTGAVAEPLPDLDRPVVVVDGLHSLDESATGKTVAHVAAGTTGILPFTLTAPDDGGDDWRYKAMGLVRFENGTERSAKVSGKLDAGASERRTLALPNGTRDATLTITWDDGLVRFGDPALVLLVDRLFDNERYLTHPTFFAGWVGMLVTGINLLPASQLDGGHVARAVLGERMKWAAYAAVGALVYLALRFESWMLMAVFILLMGVQHPPPLNDRTALDVKRKVLAALVLAVFALTFVPRPIIG